MSKNPFLNASAALLYIMVIASIMYYGTSFVAPVKSVIAPIAVLSLFTLSAAIMGYVFLFQPFQLYLDGKKKGVTWDDFFKSLPMKLTKDCLTTGTGQLFCTNDSQVLNFYVNGGSDPNALEKEIMQGDKLLVTYGNKSEGEINEEIKQIPEVN